MELRRRDTGETRPLRDGMVLGRLPACDWPVDAASVSRRHARIERRDGDWWVVDLGSSNGTKVDGRRVDQALLHPGSLLTLGDVAFDVTGETPPQSRPAAASGASAARTSPRGAAPSSPPARGDAEAERERARLRAELRRAERSRGLGDLGQQPLWVRLLLLALGLGFAALVAWGVRLAAGVV